MRRCGGPGSTSGRSPAAVPSWAFCLEAEGNGHQLICSAGRDTADPVPSGGVQERCIDNRHFILPYYTDQAGGGGHCAHTGLLMATHLQSNGPFVGVVRSASCCAGARPNQAGPTSKAALACRGKQHQELLHLTGIHRVQSDRHCYRPLVRMLASSSQLLPAARLSSRSHGSSGLCTVVHPRIVRQRAPLAAKAHRQEDGQAELTETFSALQKSMPLLAVSIAA